MKYNEELPCSLLIRNDLKEKTRTHLFILDRLGSVETWCGRQVGLDQGRKKVQKHHVCVYFDVYRGIKGVSILLLVVLLVNGAASCVEQAGFLVKKS